MPVQVRLWAPLHLKFINMNSISVILPAFDDLHNLNNQISQLNKQVLSPNEIIIVDSSSNNEIQDNIKNLNTEVLIKYYRIGRGLNLIDTYFYFQRYLVF